ncbi:MAG: adenylyl-sulfate kinase [Candidatus Saliniplasma sp.]
MSKNKNVIVNENKWSKENVKEGFTLWFTGLSGSGKSAVADRVANRLEEEQGHLVERLDGDIVRQHLTKDLGFTKEDRDTNIERVSFVAKLLSRNGVSVLASFISPYKARRNKTREMVTNFIEVFVNCPVSVCEERDVKGLYKKARAGEIDNFTGISDPYEEPEDPEIKLNTHEETIDESVQNVIDYLEENGYI